MIFDATTLLSDAQAITATAISQNVIDLGPVAIQRDIGMGVCVPFVAQVVEEFEALTSLTVEVVTADDAALATNAEAVASQTVAVDALVPGKVMSFDRVPRGVARRYLGLRYTVTGSAPTSGKITAGVVMGVPSYG